MLRRPAQDLPSPPEPSLGTQAMDSDDLGPARGILLGIVLSVLVWGGITLALMRFGLL